MDTTTLSCRIVLIDDDPICHFISEKMIRRFSSHAVEAFTHAQKALEQLEWRADNAPDQLPDVIFLDLDMPKMNGWQFLEEFNKLPARAIEKTSVYILTSSDHYMDKARAKDYTVVKEFIQKPITEEIIHLIKKNA